MKSFIAAATTAVSLAAAQNIEPISGTQNMEPIPGEVWFMDGLVYGLDGYLSWDSANCCHKEFERAIPDYVAATELIQRGKYYAGYSDLFEVWD